MNSDKLNYLCVARMQFDNVIYLHNMSRSIQTSRNMAMFL